MNAEVEAFLVENLGELPDIHNFTEEEMKELAKYVAEKNELKRKKQRNLNVIKTLVSNLKKLSEKNRSENFL